MFLCAIHYMLLINHCGFFCFKESYWIMDPSFSKRKLMIINDSLTVKSWHDLYAQYFISPFICYHSKKGFISFFTFLSKRVLTTSSSFSKRTQNWQNYPLCWNLQRCDASANPLVSAPQILSVIFCSDEPVNDLQKILYPHFFTYDDAIVKKERISHFWWQ